MAELIRRDAKARQLWETGSRPGDRSANDLALAGCLRRHGIVDEAIQRTLRVYPLGQIGSGKLAGAEAARRIDRILAELDREPGVEGCPDDPEPPRPLMRPEEPPTAYPVDELGELLGAAARAIHDKVQAPLAICGTSVLAAATLAAQPFADVVLPTGQSRPLSGYYVSVAASGERKTSTDHEALAPIEERERELRAAYEADLAAHEDALAAWKAERTAILADKKLKGRAAKEGALNDLGPAPVAPMIPMLTAPEPTYEGLCRLLATGHPSVGVFSAEGGQFVGGHAMSPENKLKTAAALSDLWDKGMIKRLRAGDGALSLPGRRVSLHLMAQPGVVERLLGDPVLADQGLLSRLLVTAPETMAGKRSWRAPKPESEAALTKYRKVLLAMLRRPLPLAVDKGTGQAKPNELSPRELPLSAAARELWIAWADHCDAAMAPGGDLEMVRAQANKLPEQAARVAGVLALVDDVNCTEIGRVHLERAIELVKHHAAEAARLARAGRVAPDLRLAQRLLDWLINSWREALVSLPDIYQRSLNAIGDKATAARIVGILVDHGWLTKLEGGAEVAGVRRRDVWAIHGKDRAA